MSGNEVGSEVPSLSLLRMVCRNRSLDFRCWPETGPSRSLDRLDGNDPVVTSNYKLLTAENLKLSKADTCKLSCGLNYFVQWIQRRTRNH